MLSEQDKKDIFSEWFDCDIPVPLNNSLKKTVLKEVKKSIKSFNSIYKTNIKLKDDTLDIEVKAKINGFEYTN